MNGASRQTAPSVLTRWVPGLAVFRDYRREWLPADLLAGFSVCVVMIPSVLAYAELAGVRPEATRVSRSAPPEGCGLLRTGRLRPGARLPAVAS